MTTYQRAHVHTGDDIRAIADHAGSYFFTPDTMAFFSSRLHQNVRALDGTETREGHRYLFITSERHGDAPRHYALRMAVLESGDDGRPAVDITTVGDYHASKLEALAAMGSYQEG